MSESTSSSNTPLIVAGIVIAVVIFRFVNNRRPSNGSNGNGNNSTQSTSGNTESTGTSSGHSNLPATTQQRSKSTQNTSNSKNTLLDRYDVTGQQEAPSNENWAETRDGREAHMNARRQQMIMRARERFMQLDG